MTSEWERKREGERKTCLALNHVCESVTSEWERKRERERKTCLALNHQ